MSAKVTGVSWMRTERMEKEQRGEECWGSIVFVREWGKGKVVVMVACDGRRWCWLWGRKELIFYREKKGNGGK